MPTHERKHKSRLAAEAEEAFGGKWAVEQYDDTTIVMKNKQAKQRPEQTNEATWQECLNLCRLRVALKTGAEKIRNNVDRGVRWDCVQAVWKWLTDTLPTCSAMVADTFPLVWCRLWLVVMLMLHTFRKAEQWQKVDPQKPGELWLRVGADGVPLWKSQVVACTVAVCSDLSHLDMHSPGRHFVFCVLRGAEKKETLAELLRTAGIVEDVTKLEGLVVTIKGQPYVVRVFLCGDHMLMYKIAGRDPPACMRPEKRPCPYCDSCPANVASYKVPAPPMAASNERLFTSIPCEQHAIDCSHGIVNVLYTVELPIIYTWLSDVGGMTGVSIERFMSNIDADWAHNLETGDADGGDPLPRSISNALKFFNNHIYNRVVAKVRSECQHVIRFEGQDVEVHKLCEAMFVLTHRMLKVAYDPKPNQHDIDRACNGTATLRKVLDALGAKCTPWMHVWTCHVPQFLRLWGTLQPFLCHGFEGRWRDLKTEIKLSSHGQWKGAKCGFETVIHYSIVTWALMSLKVPLMRRTYHVSKSHGAAFWDAFVNYAKELPRIVLGY